MLALQCGGSDGYSGITANPALGAAVDLLVAPWRHRDPVRDAGDLRRRASADPPRRDREVGEKLVERIRWWEDYTAPQCMAAWTTTPRPGNKAGGLTTILEKSLGAAAKGGTTHAERRLSTMPSRSRRRASSSWTRPATIPVSATGQVAGGANILCFTTGRGSAYGCKPTPSIKLATNTDDLPAA